MKRMFISAILIMLAFAVSAAAADTAHEEYSNILNDAVFENGAFDGKNGVIYASLEKFYYDTDMLFIVTAGGTEVKCSVYAVNDGAECLDTLSLDMSGADVTLSVIEYDDMSYLMLKRESRTEFFAVLDDSFTHVPEIEYSGKTDIARFKNGRADTLSNTPRELYNFLNSLRLETIKSYPYMNKVNTVDSEFSENLKRFLTACAGLTEFDRGDYDYDRIFKYVLFTHPSFKSIVPGNPLSGGDDIKMVNGEYIDAIMTNILKIPVEHPDVTALTERGFCYRDGMYMYTGGFSAEYDTEILDIIALHDLGAGNYHVVFSDIYRENGSETPEYSFAIVNYTDGGFSLVRLGMGKDLLTEHQISRYSVIADMQSPAWERDNIGEDGSRAENGVKTNAVILASALAALFAAIAAAWWYIVIRIQKKG